MMPWPDEVGAHQLLDVERGLAEEVLAALLLERQQPALDRADRGRADPAVLRARARCAFSPTKFISARRSLRSSSSRPWSSATSKATVEHALLGLVEAEQAREQQRAHLRDRGPDRMALLAEQVPEHDRAGARRRSPRADRARRARRAWGWASPAWLMPERSPLTSARNTGTPVAEKPSARICSDTVLPVPVAPAIRPWRLASRRCSSWVVSPLPTRMACSWLSARSCSALILRCTPVIAARAPDLRCRGSSSIAGRHEMLGSSACRRLPKRNGGQP